MLLVSSCLLFFAYACWTLPYGCRCCFSSIYPRHGRQCQEAPSEEDEHISPVGGGEICGFAAQGQRKLLYIADRERTVSGEKAAVKRREQSRRSEDGLRHDPSDCTSPHSTFPISLTHLPLPLSSSPFVSNRIGWAGAENSKGTDGPLDAKISTKS